MKQILFLLLFPCLALAQYQGNANQKITLGEQTTADGLVYRGVAADTTLTVKSDTAAYFVLDTVNLNLYTYKASASGRKWRQLGADTAAIAYVNTYGTQTVNGAKTFTSELTATRFNPTGTSATGNGMYLPATNTLGFSTNGTNRMTLNASGNLSIGNTNNTYKLDVTGKGLFENNSNSAHELIIKNTTAGTNSEAYLYIISDIAAGSTTLGKFSSTTTPYKIIGASNAYWYNGIAGDIAIINNFDSGAIKMSAGGSSTAQLTLNASGNLGIGITPDEKLHVNGNAKISAVGTASASNSALYITNTGVLSTNVSDVNKKHNIRNLPYGLNTINNLNPVAFEWNETDETDIGFIAQDIENVIPESVITNWDSELIFRQEKIIPVLVKAIQEQQALIKALEQRILNLENK